MRLNKVTVLGVGLIGASFALAIKRQGLCGHVTGFGRSEANLKRAKQRGIIDSYSADAAAACKDADLVMLSSPVGSFADLVSRCSSSFKKGAIITDAGSVKGGLVRGLERLMPAGVSYIGGHPIAGSDRSGIDASDAGLFQGAKCILTPTSSSDKAALDIVAGIWSALGSQVVTMEPEVHDRIYAAVSHLPHIIAYTMINTVADIDESFIPYGGQGLRDTTRIASSSPELWRDICMLNRENLTEMISLFQKNLNALKRYMNAADSASIEKEFERARKMRAGLGQD